MSITLFILFTIFIGIWGAKKLLFAYFMSHYTPPPVTITASKTKAQSWKPYLESTGTLVAVSGADLSTEANGIVTKIYFKSGQKVQKGMTLLELDTRVQQAQLANNIAQMKLARITLNRDKQLYEKRAAAKSVYDQTLVKMEQAQAEVDRIKAIMAQKVIVAPFSGKLGIRKVNIGEYVSAGKNLVTLQALDPLYVNFSLPQQYFKKLKIGQTAEIYNNAYPKQNFVGKITAINSKINVDTRNILIQASLPNPKNILVPGMFVQIHVVLPTINHVVTAPQTAISYSLYGDSVYILEPTKQKTKKGKPIYLAYRRFIKVGQRRGNTVVILKGVKPNQWIVTSGQIKLQNKTRVIIDNTIRPAL